MGAILARHLFAILLVSVLLASAFAFGSWLLSRVPGERRPLERVLFGTALGAGALGLAFLGLGWVGLLAPLPLWTAVGLAGAIGWRDLRRLPEMLRHTLDRAGPFGTPLGVTAGGVTLVVTVVLGVAALAPTTDWDSLMYQLEIPRQFLAAGRIHLPEDNLHVAFVGLVQMLYLPLLAVGGSSGPALLNAGFALLLGLAVLSAGARIFGRTTGMVSLIVLWGTASVVLVAATARVDVTLALFLFLAHYGVLISLEDRDEWGVIVAAILAGLAIGIKYQSLPYVAALVPFAGWGMIRISKSNRRKLWRLLGICAALLMMSALPWVLKNTLLIGEPLYPFFSDPILPPWLADLTGSASLPSTVSPEIHGVLRQAREPVTLRALLFTPADLTVEDEARSFVTNPAMFLLPLSLLFVRTRAVAAVLVVPLAYLFLIVVPFESTNLRYLIPAVPALTLATVEGVRRVGEKLVTERLLRTVLLIGSLLALIPATKAVRKAVGTRQHVASGLGLLSASNYLASSGVAGFPAYIAATRWLNEHTTPASRIVLLFEARGYYFQRDVLQDNVLTNWPLLIATGAPERCLKDTGITHIVTNLGAVGYYKGKGMNLDDLGWNLFPEFANRCLELVYREEGFELFSVK